MLVFYECIGHSEIFEPRFENVRFTWMVSGSRNAASRTEFFFCYSEIIEELPYIVLILLSSKHVSLDPTPFRIEKV